MDHRIIFLLGTCKTTRITLWKKIIQMELSNLTQTNMDGSSSMLMTTPFNKVSKNSFSTKTIYSEICNGANRTNHTCKCLSPIFSSASPTFSAPSPTFSVPSPTFSAPSLTFSFASQTFSVPSSPTSSVPSLTPSSPLLIHRFLVVVPRLVTTNKPVSDP
jgi:hypothetical protein